MVVFTPAPAWWDPFCHAAPYDPLRFDLSACFEDSTLALVPVVILAAGAAGSSRLVRQYLQGERPEKGGQGAYAVKLVSLAERQQGGGAGAVVGRQGPGGG